MTTGEKVVAFIERYCKVPEGSHVGKPIKLDDFQKRFILDVYDNPHTTRRAYLSTARKNGKTALIACLALAHIAGPVAVQNSQIISGARSRDQASLVMKLATKMINLDPDLTAVTKVNTSLKMIHGLRKSTEYRAISAEAKTAHGLSPVVSILDEVGQVRGPKDDFVDAIETSQGAHESPLLFAISTQAAKDDDLFSIWLDDAQNSGDPTIVCHVHQAPEGCELDDEDAWRLANPAMGNFRSFGDMQALAEKARRMPSFEPTFRNLNLNQRVEMNSPFVSRDVWKSCGQQGEVKPGDKVWGGLDLSAVADLTALVLANGVDHIKPYFWLPEDGIVEKSRNDRVPYDLWAKQGHLLLTPGKSIQYEYIAHVLLEVFKTYDVQAIAFDRYNMKFLRPWLERAGFSESQMAKFVDFGQGYISMSPALRELESRLLDGRIRHGAHPVLSMCAANATVMSDPAGNRKLIKGKSTGRIDGMVALAMSIGVQPMPKSSKAEPEYQVFFV